jgi:hypothetical protein
MITPFGAGWAFFEGAAAGKRRDYGNRTALAARLCRAFAVGRLLLADECPSPVSIRNEKIICIIDGTLLIFVSPLPASPEPGFSFLSI